MRVLLPEKPKRVSLQLGDMLKSPHDTNEVYILSKLDDEYAWFKPCSGNCGNGRYKSLEALQMASENYFNDNRYTIYSIKDYDLKLVLKEGK
jgi:hypothetical protein